MSHPEPQGFAAAQAKYENAHPDDNICPCQIEHEKDDNPGYDLATAYTCDHEGCHSHEDWWRARYFIQEEFIEDEVELAFAIGVLGDIPNATKEILSAAFRGFEAAKEKMKELKGRGFENV